MAPGAVTREAEPWRDTLAAAASWLEAFAAPGYGPHGRHKLIRLADGDAVVCRSPATALREAGTEDSVASPFLDLVRQVQTHAGDQATAALLVAARLVRAPLSERPRSVRPWIDGYRLAHRQAGAVLAGLARPATPSAAIRSVVPAFGPKTVADAVAALEALAEAGTLELDQVEVATAPVPAPVWLSGVLVRPDGVPHTARRIQDAGVLVTGAGPRDRPGSGDTTLRLRHPASGPQRSQAHEVARHLERLGVWFWVCRGGVDEDLRDRLAGRGGLTWSGAPRDACARIMAASGATQVAGPLSATGADLGRADLRRLPPRRGGWLVEGPGPGATWLLPCQSGSGAMVRDDGERFLRAAGCVMGDPRVLPGAGAWQEAVARSLGSAADHAPGRAPIGMKAAAMAFEALRHDLVRNAGGDPHAAGSRDASHRGDGHHGDGHRGDGQREDGAARDTGEVPAGPVLDPYACVRIAVDAAFEAAIQLLRIDARHDKRPSAPAALRGGTGPAGSPRGMPGDIPPLM